uniref:Mos1 transposase HTH domain-containing protein n=1 Tax=Anolis carolinensis TaxID=28377 RepID=A0A803TSH8_ANOCA
MEPCADGQSMQLKQRAVIEFLTAEGVTPKEIHQRMQAVYGDCIDVSTVCHWVTKFKNVEVGTSDLRDKQRVDRLIQDYCLITQREISSILSISQECVGHIIVLLGYQKIFARWVPRMLMPEMKVHRLEICQEVLSHYENEGDAFLHSIVTGDETWLHHYDQETKCQSMEYRHKDSLQKKKFKTQHPTGKNHDNSEKGNVFLQHDNARPHTSHATTAELQRLDLTTVWHPPYSPDLASSDFHLFPIMKEDLREHHYASDEDVEITVRRWLWKQSVDFFRDSFRKLVHRWQKCIQLSGDYMEK